MDNVIKVVLFSYAGAEYSASVNEDSGTVRFFTRKKGVHGWVRVKPCDVSEWTLTRLVEYAERALDKLSA